MYRNKQIYKIKYTDVDCNERLKISSLLSYFEESAGVSASELDFGYADITPKGLAFILANYYIEFIKPIRLGDILEIYTWPLKPTKLICLRDYEVYCGGEKIAVATSRWCIIDFKNYKIMPTNVLFENDCREYNDSRSVIIKNWKIPCPDNLSFVYDRVVRYSDYDYYNHVNNTKYADFALDAFDIEFLSDKFISNFQISYVKQCKAGERISFFKGYDKEFYYIEGRVADEVRCQIKIKFQSE